MHEVRLMFVISIVSLTVASLSCIAALADTLILLVAAAVLGGFAWHATTSDAGTVRLYERYTGLTITDRWPSFHDAKFVDRVMELLRPYGFVHGSEEREILHERAEPAVEALMRRLALSRKVRKDLEHKGFSELRQPGKSKTRIGGILSSPARLIRPRGLTRERAVRGGEMTAAVARAQRRSAMVLQAAWRERHAMRPEECSGWLFKTASSNGPIDSPRGTIHGTGHSLRDVVVSHRGTRSEAHSPDVASGSLAAGGVGITEPMVVTSRELQDLLPMVEPTFARWCVLNVPAASLAIYTTDADIVMGLPPKIYIKDLRSYAAIRLQGDQGRHVIALLPRQPQSQTYNLDAGAAPGGDDAASRGRMLDQATSVPEGRSWYLQAKRDQHTFQWLVWLRRAGAASSVLVPGAASGGTD